MGLICESEIGETPAYRPTPCSPGRTNKEAFHSELRGEGAPPKSPKKEIALTTDVIFMAKDCDVRTFLFRHYYKLYSLLHRFPLLPRHDPPPPLRALGLSRSVTYVLAEMCYLCPGGGPERGCPISVAMERWLQPAPC